MHAFIFWIFHRSSFFSPFPEKGKFPWRGGTKYFLNPDQNCLWESLGFPLGRVQSYPQWCWTLGPKAAQTQKSCWWQIRFEADLEMLCHSPRNGIQEHQRTQPPGMVYLCKCRVLMQALRSVSDFNEVCFHLQVFMNSCLLQWGRQHDCLSQEPNLISPYIQLVLSYNAIGHK